VELQSKSVTSRGTVHVDEAVASETLFMLLAGSTDASDSRRAVLALVAGGGDAAAAEALRLLVADTAVAGILAGGRSDDEIFAEVANVVDDLGEDAAAFRFASFARALSSPSLCASPPSVAADTVLRLLMGFACVDGASLWMVDAGGEPACASAVGASGARSSEAAAGAFASGAPAVAGSTVAVPQRRLGKVVGVLMADARPGQADRVASFLDTAAASLQTLLERDLLLERSAEREKTISGSLEKRLTRVAFDLHDGPLQDLAALGLDLDLARRQIDSVVGDADRARVAGRFDDLAARLVGLDVALRSVVQSLKGTCSGSESVAHRLERDVAALRDEGLNAWIEIGGDLSSLSDSQQIAVLRVVQEALENVREHSGATVVHVRVAACAGGVEATIEDDGHGFDLASAEADATSRQRFGLAGMRERIRLLGGELRIDSAPGRGTRVGFVLRPWTPLAPRDGEPHQVAA
jgi:signal transduction histidine kinase